MQACMPELTRYVKSKQYLPLSLKSASYHPQNRFNLFHSLSPCLTITILYLDIFVSVSKLYHQHSTSTYLLPLTGLTLFVGLTLMQGRRRGGFWNKTRANQIICGNCYTIVSNCYTVLHLTYIIDFIVELHFKNVNVYLMRLVLIYYST